MIQLFGPLDDTFRNYFLESNVMYCRIIVYVCFLLTFVMYRICSTVSEYININYSEEEYLHNSTQEACLDRS